MLAAVMLGELALTMAGTLACFWLIVTKQAEIGACGPGTAVAREIFGELLTAILALLLAGKGPPK